MSLIVSWNINSVRSRLQLLVSFIKEQSPDVILLQEIKCEGNQFPFLELEDLGYNISLSGQKTYNGVAILSKSRIEDVFTDLLIDEKDEFKNEARYIEALVYINDQPIRVASIYAPQGTELNSERFNFKLRFYKHLKSRFNKLIDAEEMLVAGGDYNVAPDPIDVYDPKSLNNTLGFHINERKEFWSILNSGMIDSFRLLYPDKQEFSWWDYRSNGWKYNKGMRIDQILVSAPLLRRLVNAGIHTEVRSSEKPSDHAPIWIELA
jgi:exodeoxyribonuclease-3